MTYSYTVFLQINLIIIRFTDLLLTFHSKTRHIKILNIEHFTVFDERSLHNHLPFLHLSSVSCEQSHKRS